MEINHRAYQKETDVQLVRELLSENYALTQHSFYTVDPPNWERMCAASATGSSERRIHLWEVTEQAARKLVGIVVFQKNQEEFSCLVLSGYQEVNDSLYDWVEREHQANRPAQTDKWTLSCSVSESNAAQKAILTQRGYTQLPAELHFRRRSLDAPIPELAPPEGYVIQQLQNLSDESLAERAAGENQVFDRTITAAFLRRLQDAPIYRPELDLVMLAADGTVAAFCTAWFDARHRIGICEPVGTLAAHRQRGLAKMLMYEGFRRLRAFGAITVSLGHSASNVAAARLYDSVGMSVFDQESLWQKDF